VLRNDLERAVWAAAFAPRAHDPRAGAVEADTAVRNLRRWELQNGSPHALDMALFLTEEGELDLDALDVDEGAGGHG